MNQDDAQYYFDTSALFKFYRDEAGSQVIRDLVENSPRPILISPLTVLECFDAIMYQFRKGDVHGLTEDQASSLLDRLRRDYSPKPETTRHFLLLSAPPYSFYRRAESLLLQYAGRHGRNIGANDALHIAVAEKLQTDFPVIMATSDKGMKNVCQNLNIPIFDAGLE